MEWREIFHRPAWRGCPTKFCQAMPMTTMATSCGGDPGLSRSPSNHSPEKWRPGLWCPGFEWKKSRVIRPMGPIAGCGWILATKSHIFEAAEARGLRHGETNEVEGWKSQRRKMGFTQPEKAPWRSSAPLIMDDGGAVPSSFLGALPHCFGVLASCEAMKAMMKPGAWGCPQSRWEMGGQRTKRTPRPLCIPQP